MEVRPIDPMLLKEVRLLPDDPNRLYEIKEDGWRCIAYQYPNRTVLRSRSGISISDRFPGLTRALPEALDGTPAILDGELVGFNREDREDRNVLIGRYRRVEYRIFDILHYADERLISLPLSERKAILFQKVAQGSGIRFVRPIIDRETALLEAIRDEREGVVAKRMNSRYHPGRRSDSWLKQILAKTEPGYSPRKRHL